LQDAVFEVQVFHQTHGMQRASFLEGEGVRTEDLIERHGSAFTALDGSEGIKFLEEGFYGIEIFGCG